MLNAAPCLHLRNRGEAFHKALPLGSQGGLDRSFTSSLHLGYFVKNSQSTGAATKPISSMECIIEANPDVSGVGVCARVLFLQIRA